MAVVPMSLVSVYGLKKNRKAILEALQRYGVLEVTDIEFDGLAELDTSSSQGTFSKAILSAENALSILKAYVPENSSLFDMFSGKKVLDVGLYYKYVEEIGEIMRVANKINQLSKQVAEKKSEIARLNSQIEGLKPWMAFDLPLAFRGTKKTSAFIGVIEGRKSTEQIISEFSCDFADVNVISSSNEQTCVFVVCPKERQAETEEKLREIGFARPTVSSDVTPPQKIRQFEDAIIAAEKKIEKCETEIAGYAGHRNAIKFAADYYSMRLEKYKVIERAGYSKRTFALKGYAPQKTASALETVLSKKYNAAVEVEAADDNAPVLLRNNAFSEPAESVLETFSMPGKGEMDPTSIMSFFYYLLFGLMLSDFAYGIIMAVGCWFVTHHFREMDTGLKKSLKMFMYCGISTAFWGLMFGGCFGDAITIISSTFFGKTVNFPTLWFAPLDNVMKMLLISFGLGVVHLFTGLALKLYQSIKNGEVLEGIYDVVFWYMLVGGGIVYLLTVEMVSSMFKLAPLPASVGKVAAIIAGIGALGIVIFAGRSSKNPFKRLAKGLYELYNVSGYLSDILSYSRLLALGLATGVIAQVFNKMGSMAGGGVLGAIVFIIVFILGHLLNMGINILGAYVHTNRLQFVEFFGKFYEGGGSKYQPFSENTKYFKIREDI